MRCLRSLHPIALFALLIAWSPPSNATDVAVYESLDDVHIGSVFFSPEDREQLDKKRDRKSVRNSHDLTKGAASVRRYDSAAAGYIVGRSGHEKIYYRGDFVAVAVPSDRTFPGDVEIVKSTAAVPSLTPDSGDENSQDTADEDD